MDIIPQDGMKIDCNTRLARGVYYLPHGIEIVKDGITLDGNGALLIGEGFAGRGVVVNRHSGVNIRNLQVERYYHGIWVNASANIRIERCHITRTHEVAGPDVFLDIWLDHSQAYGAGIIFNGVIDSSICDNDLQHQQNGVMLYGCHKVEVARNNASFNSGAGMLLFESSDNAIQSNIADFCCRIYNYRGRDGAAYHNGADAAALVMMCNSSRNHISHNLLRGGGDGVFLGGFHKDQIKTPCNDNVFEHNDGSWSPNIAFEATFSEHNIFRHNKADNCNYGFWLGYSSHTTVADNSIVGNRIAGVAIEQGHHNAIRHNTFARNRDGVQFWVGARPAFTNFYPECAESYETDIADNEFTRHDSAIRIWTEREAAALRCHNFRITGNTISDNRIAAQIERVRDSIIQNNRIKNNVESGLMLIGCQDVQTSANEM